MKSNFLQLTALALGITTALGAQANTKQDPTLEVIEVTARKKVETLQDVPDAITAFNSAEIESARIDNVNDFAKLTPNLVIRDGFRAGVAYITMRGINTPQQGLPPVTFVVDGVQVGAMDFINQDLNGIERIEVLRGPQGALYGAGAMAGAINIITKAPTEDWSGNLGFEYAEGNDKKLSASASGGVANNLFTQVNVNLQDADGLIESTNGDDLDFIESTQISNRWQYLGDAFSADIRLAIADYEQGAIMQDFLPPVSDKPKDINLDDFSAKGPERGFIGKEEREFTDFRAKLNYELNYMDITWISAIQEVEQHLIGDLDFSAAPLVLQDLTDNFEVSSHELRLSGSGDNYHWLAGVYRQERDALTDLTPRYEPTPGEIGMALYSQIDVKNDTISAAFAQYRIDLTDALELTLAARYDKVEYDSTRYATRALKNIVQLRNKNGDLVDTQVQEDTSFQPKVSLSYDLNSDNMVYATYAEGFRPGFFNSGSLTISEYTENFEIGFKSSLLDNRAQLNGALFHIDYSNQQVSNIIAEAPFRVTATIPETKISGIELEGIMMVTEDLRLTFGYGFTDAEIQNLNIRSIATPEHTVNLGLLHTMELDGGWQLQNRIDARMQSDMVLGTIDPTQERQAIVDQLLSVGDKEYLNISTALENEQWRVTLYADNVTDEFTTTEANYVEGLLGVVTGVIRNYTPGRQVGVSLKYKF